MSSITILGKWKITFSSISRREKLSNENVAPQVSISSRSREEIALELSKNLHEFGVRPEYMDVIAAMINTGAAPKTGFEDSLRQVMDERMRRGEACGL